MRLDILRGVVKENVDGPKRTEEFKEEKLGVMGTSSRAHTREGPGVIK